MKRHFYLLLICLVCLTACNQASPTSGESSVPDPSTGSSIDPSTSQSDSPEPSDTAAPTSGILAADTFDPILQVGNTVVTLPTAYSDLIASGAENVDTKYNDTYLVDAGAYHIVSFNVGDTQFKAHVHNDTDDRIQIKDCLLKSIYSTQGEALFYPGGVHVGMALDELTAAWGEPSEDLSKNHEDKLTYRYVQYPFDYKRFGITSFSMGGESSLLSATGNAYTVSISRSTSQVIDISRNFTEGVGSGALFEDSKEFTNMLTGEPTLLRYSLPENFYHNTYTQGGRRISALTVDGTVYIATIDIPSMSLKLQDGEDPSRKLTNSITTAYAYDVKVLQSENGTAYATGYLIKDDVLYAAGGFVGDGNSYVSYETRMISLDPEGTITPEAQAAFEEVFYAFILSMHIEA